MNKFDFKNKTHQFYGVLLTMIYYTDGDFKEIYESEYLGGFMDTFALQNDDDIAKWLEINDHHFEDYEFLQLKPNKKHIKPPISWEQNLIEDQTRWVENEFGKNIEVNYGWSVSGEELNLVIDSKIYGYGILSSFYLKNKTIKHEFSPF